MFEKIPFTYNAPVMVGKNNLSQNTALRVRLEDGVFVDLTALPGLHTYTIEEWKYVIQSFFESHEFQFDDILMEKLFFNTPTTTTTSALNLSGELAYAVESVLFAWIKKTRPEVLPKTAAVKIHGLYSEAVPFETVPDCVKIKIRPGKTLELAAAINNCIARNPRVHFRFDGNCTFELSGLLQLLQSLGENCPAFYVDFIEEPFINAADFFSFRNHSAIPIALDESLPFFFDHLEKFPEDFLILKPGVLGLSRCFELTKAFFPRAVISSTYETPSAMAALYALASLNPDQYHGLDTLKFLPKHFSI